MPCSRAAPGEERPHAAKGRVCSRGPQGAGSDPALRATPQGGLGPHARCPSPSSETKTAAKTILLPMISPVQRGGLLQAVVRAFVDSDPYFRLW